MRISLLTPTSKWGPIRRTIGVWLVAFLALGPTLSAATYYVSPSGNDGRSVSQAQNPATPWKSLTRALTEPAVTSGDTISAAAGTYSFPTTGEVFPLALKNGVAVVGPTANPPTAKIYGTGTTRLFEMRGMDLSPSTRLAYFELRNFDATSGFSQDLIFFDIFSNNMSPTIDHNVFDGTNQSRKGIWVDGGDGLPGQFNALIDNNKFINHNVGVFLEDDYSPQAMQSMSPTISNNTFSNSYEGIDLSASEITVPNGASAKYSPLITGNTFTNLGYAGVAIEVSVSSLLGTAKIETEPTISNNTFDTMPYAMWVNMSVYDAFNSAQSKFAPKILNNPTITNIGSNAISVYQSLSASDSTQNIFAPVVSGNSITASPGGSAGVSVSLSGYLFDNAQVTSTATVTGNSINGGSDEGIYFNHSFYATNATSLLLNPTVSNNSVANISTTGINFYLSVSMSPGSTASVVSSPTVSGNTVSNVDYSGIYMSVSISGSGGGTATASPVVSGNTVNGSAFGPGISLSFSMSSLNSGTWNAQVTNNNVSNTSYSGLLVDLTTDYTPSANTTLLVSGNTVTAAGSTGINVDLSHYSDGNVSNVVTVNGNTSNGNDYGGIRLAVENSGSPSTQTILLTNNTANANFAAYGLYLSLYNQQLVSSNDVQVSGNVATNNVLSFAADAAFDGIKPMGITGGGAGIAFSAQNVPVNGTLVSCNTVTGNQGNGISVGYFYNAAPPDFGGGSRNSPGGNKIFGNGGGSGLYDFYNSQAQPVAAQKNWWGTTVPATIDSHIHDDDENAAVGAVDFSNFQLTARGCANTAPVANADAYATDKNVVLTVAAPGVLTNDSDAESDPMTAVLVTGPSNGTVTLSPNGGFTYTPNTNFSGTDSFTYSATDGNLASAPATVTITVVNPITVADLSIVKTALSSDVKTGEPIAYRIQVSNNGPGSSSSIVVTDQLPAGTTLTSTGGDFSSCTNSEGVVTCTLAGLAPSSSAVLTLNVTAPATGGLITNTATVTSASTDPNAGDNTSSVTTHVTSVQPPPCPSGPSNLTPPNGAAGVPNPVRFSWTPVTGATGYTVFGTIDGGPQQEFVTTTGQNSTTAQVSLTGSNITWFVRAISVDCPASDSSTFGFVLEEPDSCDRHLAASLVSPIGNQTVTSLVDYKWTSVLHANGYRVWVSIDDGPFAALESTQETTYRGIISKGNVEWFVEALFPGCPSTESQHARFNVPAAANCNNTPAAPQSPANGSTVRNQTVTFTWAAAPNAIGYEVYLSLASGSPTLIGSTFSETSIQEDVAEGEFEWFVRTLFPGCDAVDSQRSSFVFAQPPTCPTETPITLSPAEGVVGLTSPIDFSWSDTPGATAYRLNYTIDNGAVNTRITPNTFINDVEIGAFGAIEWWVDALSDGCRTLQSTPARFTVVPPPPPCATPATTDMRASANASSGVEYTVRWNPIPNAVFYELQESTTASFTPGTTTTFSGPSTEQPFTHVNNTPGTPRVFFYRVRGVNNCNATRGLYSEPITVGILSIRQADPSPEGSTPIEDPQPTTYQLQICTSPAPTCAFNANPGQSFSVVTDQPWLTVSPSSGTVPPNGITLIATAQPATLSAGTNTASVAIFFATPGASSNRKVPAQTTSNTSTTNVSVNLVAAVSPTPGNTPPPDALIIPAVTHGNGVNAHFESDVRVSNTSPQLMKYQLTFTPSGESGITQGKQATLDIEPGQTIGLEDVLDSWFGAESATNATSGSLEIRPLTKSASSVSSSAQSGLPNIVTFATSRTYAITGNASLGTIVPAIPYANFIGRAASTAAPSILSMQNIAQNSTHRTNLGLKEASGQPATVLVSIFGNTGLKIGEFTQNLTGGQHLQLNSVLSRQNINDVADARISVQVTSATGKVTSYASVVENANNDAQLVSPVALSQAGSAKYVLAGVADMSSAGTTGPTHTEVRLFNASSNPVTTSLSVYPSGSTTPITKQLTIAGNQVQTLDVAEFFGAANIGNAALHVNSASSTNIIATARTYTQSASGNVGKLFNAVTPSNAVTSGSRPLQLLQIEESNRFTTELGVAEVSGKSVDLEVSIIPQDSKVAVKTTIQLGPNQFQTVPQLLKAAGLDGEYNARVTVKVVRGAGAATAYASVTDKLTGDPMYVPAQ